MNMNNEIITCRRLKRFSLSAVVESVVFAGRLKDGRSAWITLKTTVLPKTTRTSTT